MKKENEAKILWFKLRTGSSEEEAKTFLLKNKWKIDNAIKAMRDSHKEKNKKSG